MKKQLHQVLLHHRAIILHILVFFSFALVVIPQAMAVEPPLEPAEPLVPVQPQEEPKEMAINYGDVSGDGYITPFDAALILQSVVGIPIMSPECPSCDLIAADVSGNGTISSYDASLVLQHSVGLISCFPVDPSCVAAPQQTTEASLRLPTLKVHSGEKVAVSVNLDKSEELLAGEFVLTYDVNSLNLVGITPEPTKLSDIERAEKEGSSVPFLIASQVRDGKIHFAFANLQDEVSPEKVLQLEFKLNEQMPYKHMIPLKLSQASFNENEVPNLHSGAIEILPIRNAILQNYPNPFNPETWFPYHLAQDASVVIRIYNIRGNLIRTLYAGNQSAGIYVTKDRAARWDGRNEFGQKVASGVYFYTLQAGGFRATRKMTILK
jgi:hypothetical protein